MERTIYTKTVDGKQIFCDGTAIRLDTGEGISNPSPEVLAENGWEVFVPPVVPPVPQTEPDLQSVMQAVKNMLSEDVQDLTDEEALDIAALFPTWSSKLGVDVTSGDRLWYNGKLYKVTQPHIPQANWLPDEATSLYTEVSIAEIPDWVQPQGSHDAYMTGNRVKHNGHTWESNIDNNVYEPGSVGAEALWTMID